MAWAVLLATGALFVNSCLFVHTNMCQHDKVFVLGFGYQFARDISDFWTCGDSLLKWSCARCVSCSIFVQPEPRTLPCLETTFLGLCQVLREDVGICHARHDRD